MERNITLIPARHNMTEGSSALQQGKFIVAAYCRVSTNEEDQLLKRGILHLNTNRFMGYDKDDKGNLVINKNRLLL